VYEDYFQDIIESAVAIKGFMGKMTEKKFVFDRETRFAVTRAIEVMGEAGKNIPKKIRKKHLSVPLRKWLG